MVIDTLSPEYLVPFVKVVGGTFIASEVLEKVVLRGLNKLFLGKLYANFIEREKVAWDQRVLRSIFAFFCLFSSLWLVFHPDAAPARDDKIFGTHPYLDLFTQISVGFFIYETLEIFIFKARFRQFEAALAAHHILALGFTSTFSIFNPGQLGMFWTLTFPIEEFSAPFTGASWILTKMGLRDSIYWIINQALLLVVWVVIRFGMDFYVLYHVVLNFDGMITHIPLPNLFFIFVSLLSLLLYLNPLWFSQKVKEFNKWFKPASPVTPGAPAATTVKAKKAE